VGNWTYAIYVVLVLGIILVVLAAFTVVTVRSSFPDTSGEVQISALDGDVTIVTDEYGIPQIYADTAEDLFAAQGYVHAQDRFFQMDFRRHVPSGTLAELFGRSALPTDKFARTLGWRRVARAELKLLKPATRRYLQAYASGVNAYIHGKDGGDLSLEYSVLALTGPDYRPSPWTAVDSLAWLKAISWDLRSNMADEIDRVLASQKVGGKMLKQLYPQFPYDLHDPIVTTGAVRGQEFSAHAAAGQGQQPGEDGSAEVDAARALQPMRDVATVARDLPVLLGTGEGIGSNSWVVSGQRTTTGKPILA